MFVGCLVLVKWVPAGPNLLTVRPYSLRNADDPRFWRVVAGAEHGARAGSIAQPAVAAVVIVTRTTADFRPFGQYVHIFTVRLVMQGVYPRSMPFESFESPLS